MMHGHEKSDPSIVAVKPANEGGRPPAELVEPRGGAEGNADRAGMRRTPSRASMSHGLDRVRQAARTGKEERFTALLHHVDVELLRSAYGWLRKEASAGVDGVTWEAYGEGLEAQARRPARPYPSGCLPGATVTTGVYTEAGRTTAAAGHRSAGGQDRPAGAGGSAERDLGGRLPGVQLRVPARAWPA